MRNGSALLTSRIDCESIKDFYQYYKDRYFGYQGDIDRCWPCMISPMEAPAPHHLIITYWNPNTSQWVAVDYMWNDFIQAGSFRFGYPNLGTIPFGPTYAYIAAFPRRESAKGISLYKSTFMIPQYDFLFTKYIAKEPKLKRMIGQGYYGTPEEAETIMNLLNKRYYTWDEALSSLESGVRIGCQLNKHIGIYLDEKEDDLILSFKDIGKFARVRPYLNTFRVELGASYKHLTQLAVESLYLINKDLIIV